MKTNNQKLRELRKLCVEIEDMMKAYSDKIISNSNIENKEARCKLNRICSYYLADLEVARCEVKREADELEEKLISTGNYKKRQPVKTKKRVKKPNIC